MINNIIFDLGNVLLKFRPYEYLRKEFKCTKKIDKLYESIFDSEEWIELDKGIIDQKRAVEIFAERNGLAEETQKIFSDWDKILLPIEDSIKILNKLYEEGYNLFILSNFHQKAFEEVKQYDFFSKFKDIVISAKINLIKPKAAVYKYILEKNELIPEKTLFIDDIPENIKGARKHGINAVLFQNPGQLKNELCQRGII